MTHDKMEARAMQLLADEAGEPLLWWWLSYANEERFLGVTIVRARGFIHAVLSASLLKISPGGEVKGVPIPPEMESHLPVMEYRNRLLNKAELDLATAPEGGVRTWAEMESEGAADA